MIADAPKLPQLIANAKAEGWAEWIKSPADELAVLHGCRFDVEASLRPVQFFEKFLRHSKGRWAGQPFKLLPWQRENIVQPLFGWYRADGRRRINKTYIEIPKKQGKSTLAAGIGTYLLVGDGEHGACVYSLATSSEQANIVHSEAVNMVKQSPGLSKHLKINHSTGTIAFEKTMSYYKRGSAEAAGKEGFNLSGAIIDELHVWYGRKLWETLRYAYSSRDNPIQFVITTAGDDFESVCFEQHEYAKGVIAGKIEDDRFLPFISAAEPTDDLTDPATWAKANPSMGETIRADDFAAELEAASQSASEMASFKRYRFNIWGMSENPWLEDYGAWTACEKDFDEASLIGRECYGGLDLAQSRDLSAFALAFPPDDIDGDWHLLTWFWLPEARAYAKDPMNVYRNWSDSGMIKTMPGSVCDYNEVENFIGGLTEKFDIRAFAYDPYNAEPTTRRIQEEFGVERFLFKQNVPTYAGPTKEFERLILSGKMRHNGQPVMDWQMGHVRVFSDNNNNNRPVKPKHGDRRTIDGVVASIMALGMAINEHEIVEAITAEDLSFV